MKLPTKKECIAFAMGQSVQYEEPVEIKKENQHEYPGCEVGEVLAGEIILTDEMLSRLIDFCQGKTTVEK